MSARWIDEVGIRIDRDADVPVGVQLDWSLGRAIRSGRLAPGDRLPPLRQLAEEVGVNPNTLRAVYARLEAVGLIKARHGSGTFVTGSAGAEDLDALVASVSDAARAAGVGARELAAALYVAPERPADPELERRRMLREEIAVLERVLSSLPRRVAAPEAASGPHLPDVAALESMRNALVSQIGLATQPEEREPQRAKRPAKGKPAAEAAARSPRVGPATA